MVRTIEEECGPDSIPLWRQPEWRDRFPWLEQGTTGRGSEDEPFDLGVFGGSPVGPTMERWRRLRVATGMRTAVHARQVHGVEVGAWDQALPAGLFLGEGLDAHVTGQAELLLAVSTADCVPIFLVCEETRTLGLVHAGWRGVAGGGLEAAVGMMQRRGVKAANIWMHCGPAICGKCYEVGPEVHSAVYPERPPPAGPQPIDIRQALAERASRLGFSSDRITISGHCTKCGPGDFFSHRGGSPARQMGVLGRHDIVIPAQAGTQNVDDRLVLA